MQGRKDDKAKLKYNLVPWIPFEEVVKVLMAGAEEYGPFNWQQVEHLTERYSNAMMRHLVAYQKGEVIDPQFGIHHLAHAICCGLFCMWKDLTEGIPPSETDEDTSQLSIPF